MATIFWKLCIKFANKTIPPRRSRGQKGPDMKYYFIDRQGNSRKLTAKEVRERLTPDQQLEAIEAKRQDPLEEVSFMTSGGVIMCEA